MKLRIMAAAAALVSGPAFAQSAPTIIVAFSIAPDTVPLGPWTSIAAMLCILLLAGVIFRRRLAGRPGLWLAAIFAAGGAAIGGLHVDAVSNAFANSGTQLPLATSPASVVIGSGNAFVTAQNTTGKVIQVSSVSLANPFLGQVIVTPPTNCAGAILYPNQTCIISVLGVPPPT